MHADRVDQAAGCDAVDRVHGDQSTGRPPGSCPLGPGGERLRRFSTVRHMPRAPRITSADLLRALYRAGWSMSRQSGSHVILVHPERAGARVVVPVHAGRILKPKTLAAILKSAEIAGDELQGLL
jgi:predicted RNA binding protein YcfA (HicA-like mRNA interferase family)